MSDSLTVFGTDYTNVTGIKAKGTGNGTLTYIRPQGTKSISANGTGIDVAAYAAVNVSVSGGGSDVLVVTLSYNDQTETWEPDCTYEEALQNSSAIAFVTDQGYYVPAAGYLDGQVFYYFVYSNYDGHWWAYCWDENGVEPDGDSDAIEPYFQTVSKTYTPTTSTQTETVTFDTSNHYNGLQEVNVTVNAMPSGTAGTPTASKGSVSNHAISVTPSVTNTTGYITGGTKNGTAVSVSASELVSGTVTISASGNTDVTNYASASVNAITLPTSASVASNSGTKKATISRSTANQYINITPGYNDSAAYYEVSAVANGTEGTPTASKGTVSNHQVSVTPSVTNTAGYISGSTKTGTAVTVTAAELASGNLPITANTNSTSCVGYSTVSVAVPIVTYYTSSSNPTSSQGSNGDIWLVTS